jgi:hypothetical protein
MFSGAGRKGVVEVSNAGINSICSDFVGKHLFSYEPILESFLALVYSGCAKFEVWKWLNQTYLVLIII